MEPSKVVKEYKEELTAVQEKNEMLIHIVAKMTVEKEWLEKLSFAENQGSGAQRSDDFQR